MIVTSISNNLPLRGDHWDLSLITLMINTSIANTTSTSTQHNYLYSQLLTLLDLSITQLLHLYTIHKLSQLVISGPFSNDEISFFISESVYSSVTIHRSLLIILLFIVFGVSLRFREVFQNFTIHVTLFIPEGKHYSWSSCIFS